MHNQAIKMARWAMDDACAKGYDCMTSQDWDDFKDCMEAAKDAIKCDYYYRLVEQMKEEERHMANDRMCFPIPDAIAPLRGMDRTSGSESWRDGGSTELDDMRNRYGNLPGMAGRRMDRSGSSRQGVEGTRGRYGFSFEEYMDTREMYPGQDQEHKKKRIDALNRELDDLVEMGKEVVQDMTAEEKQVWKGKISKILNM